MCKSLLTSLSYTLGTFLLEERGPLSLCVPALSTSATASPWSGHLRWSLRDLCWETSRSQASSLALHQRGGVLLSAAISVFVLFAALASLPGTRARVCAQLLPAAACPPWARPLATPVCPPQRWSLRLPAGGRPARGPACRNSRPRALVFTGQHQNKESLPGILPKVTSGFSSTV